MIEPAYEDTEIDGRTFRLYKVPAIACREIIAKYPVSNMPKLGEYKVSEEIMLKLISHVAVPLEDGTWVKLTTRALVDNYTVSWETLMKLEAAMIQYNCSFFQDGRLSTFLTDTAQQLPRLVTKILTDALAQLLPNQKPPSTN